MCPSVPSQVPGWDHGHPLCRFFLPGDPSDLEANRALLVKRQGPGGTSVHSHAVPIGACLFSLRYGQLSGMVEPLAGLFGAFAVVLAEPLLPYALAFAAGAMVYVVMDDIIPEAQIRWESCPLPHRSLPLPRFLSLPLLLPLSLSLSRTDPTLFLYSHPFLPLPRSSSAPRSRAV